jgi:FkbM family methyltransferase
MKSVDLRGIPFYTHDDEDLSNAIHRDKDFFEAEILDYMAINYGVQQHILDIGANIGNHSVYFANFFKYKHITAFEAYLGNYELLVKNLEPYQNVTATYIAISDGYGTLFVHPRRENLGATEVNTIESPFKVEAMPLNDLITDIPVSLIKIDVEWWEPQVISGAWNLLVEHKPLILIEDATLSYEKLLAPYFEMIKPWPHHKTYLYKWRE